MYNRNIRGRTRGIIAIEEIMDIMHKVIRGTKTITMIIEGVIIEVKVMIEIRVGL